MNDGGKFSLDVSQSFPSNIFEYGFQKLNSVEKKKAV